MYNILVVDDEQDTKDLFNEKFKPYIARGDYAFTFALDGDDALERIRHKKFDLVLTDISMPNLDGLSLIKILSKPDTNLKAIVVTAYADTKNLRAAMNSGAYDFCVKPINFTELAQIIQRALQYVKDLRQYESSTNTLQTLQKELSISSDLQQSILPRHFVDNDVVQLYAQMTTAVEIGGDFYDFFWVAPHLLGIAIADVSGKNISAALYMAIARTLLRSIAFFEHDVVKCVEKVNIGLVQDNESAMFATLVYGIFNTNTGEFSFVNAGHCPIAVLRNDGSASFIEYEIGCAVGVIEDSGVSLSKFQMQPGETLFLYTDGVTEAFDKDGAMFQEDNLLKCLKSNTGLHPKELVYEIISAVHTFCNGAPQSDDLTCLALKWIKKSSYSDVRPKDSSGNKALHVDTSVISETAITSDSTKQEAINDQPINDTHKDIVTNDQSIKDIPKDTAMFDEYFDSLYDISIHNASASQENNKNSSYDQSSVKPQEVPSQKDMSQEQNNAPPDISQKILLVNQITEVSRLLNILDKFATKISINKDMLYQLKLILDELVTNIVTYAYEDNEEHQIELNIELRKNLLTVAIKDDGKEFNPLPRDDPNVNTSLEQKPIGGLGIFFAKQLSKSIEYQYKDRHNILTLTLDLDDIV